MTRHSSFKFVTVVSSSWQAGSLSERPQKRVLSFKNSLLGLVLVVFLFLNLIRNSTIKVLYIVQNISRMTFGGNIFGIPFYLGGSLLYSTTILYRGSFRGISGVSRNPSAHPYDLSG